MSEADGDTIAPRGASKTGRDERMRDDHIQREIKYFPDFAAVYMDAIRSSDFKANIALLFPPLLMVPILGAHEKKFIPSGSFLRRF